MRRWMTGLLALVVSAAAVGVPTDVLDTNLFTRMTPVRWWEYPVLAATALLTGLWFVIPRASGDVRGRGKVFGATTLAVFAVGCPVCNKIVVALLGISGALGLWGPIQPALAVLSVAALAAAVVVRWRRRGCAEDTCGPETEPSAVGTAVADSDPAVVAKL